MSDEEKKSPPAKENGMPKDSFLDDLMYVAKESISPTADPKNAPVPGEQE